MTTNEKIALLFYKEYKRSPKQHEFEALGGNLYRIRLVYGSISTRSGYCNFLKEIGLPEVLGKGKTIEVINNRNNKIECFGIVSEIAKQFKVHQGTINRHVRNKTIFKEIYTIRVKKNNKKKMLDIIHNTSDEEVEKFKETLKNEKTI